jgi:gluconokinase
VIVVVMGVCGCGKTSVGRAIADRKGWAFIEGDDLHPSSNKEKMASGKPLHDDDRLPWLERIADEARASEAEGGSVVVACSALKRIYRDCLRSAGPDVRFVHLSGDADVIRRRMQARSDHFMPPGLLDTQLATLEPPGRGEAIAELDVALPIDDLVTKAIGSVCNSPT